MVKRELPAEKKYILPVCNMTLFVSFCGILYAGDA